MPITWKTSTNKERGDFIRSHLEYAGRDWMRERFHLTERGLDAILDGQPWCREYSTAPDA